MSKYNPHANRKDSSYQDLSKLIVSAIENEQFFQKDILLPKIKAILTAFRCNVSTANYNKIDNPTDAAKRIRLLEQKDVENYYWRNKVESIIGKENMPLCYKERDEHLSSRGFYEKIKINK